MQRERKLRVLWDLQQGNLMELGLGVRNFVSDYPQKSVGVGWRESPHPTLQRARGYCKEILCDWRVRMREENILQR